MTIHYKNPRRPKRTICVTTAKCCIMIVLFLEEAIMNNKLMIERYSEEYIDAGMNKK